MWMTWCEWILVLSCLYFLLWAWLEIFDKFDFESRGKLMETVEVVLKVTVKAKNEDDYHDQIQGIDAVIHQDCEIVSERFVDELQGRRLKCYYTKN